MSTKANSPERIYEYGETDVFRFETMDVPDPSVTRFWCETPSSVSIL